MSEEKAQNEVQAILARAKAQVETSNDQAELKRVYPWVVLTRGSTNLTLKDVDWSETDKMRGELGSGALGGSKPGWYDHKVVSMASLLAPPKNKEEAAFEPITGKRYNELGTLGALAQKVAREKPEQVMVLAITAVTKGFKTWDEFKAAGLYKRLDRGEVPDEFDGMMFYAEDAEEDVQEQARKLLREGPPRRAIPSEGQTSPYETANNPSPRSALPGPAQQSLASTLLSFYGDPFDMRYAARMIPGYGENLAQSLPSSPVSPRVMVTALVSAADEIGAIPALFRRMYEDRDMRRAEIDRLAQGLFGQGSGPGHAYLSDLVGSLDEGTFQRVATQLGLASNIPGSSASMSHRSSELVSVAARRGKILALLLALP